VPAAQVIRRLRDLGMPLEDVKAVLDAPDLAARNAGIGAHLRRMEQQLEQAQATVASLRRRSNSRRWPSSARSAWTARFARTTWSLGTTQLMRPGTRPRSAGPSS